MTTTAPGLGSYLRAARQQAGLSQTALAERLSVSQGAISMWESDVSVPSARVVAKLARELPGVEVDELLALIEVAS